jgi:uncharacterized protein (DUF488 family)
MSKIQMINTIGYEGKKITHFIQQLHNHGVTLLVDARIRTGGRKLDFCKKNLSQSLQNSGIKYVHYKELGTPDYLMREMKVKGSYSMDEYEKHLDSNPEILNRVANEIEEPNIAIMCFEKNFKECHRTVVANKLSKIVGSIVNHI